MSILLTLSRLLGLSPTADWDFGLGAARHAEPSRAAEPERLERQGVERQGVEHEPRRPELYGMAAAIHSLYQDGVGVSTDKRR